MGSLASVYHKPADSFVGKGRFGADAVQRRAIEFEPPLSSMTDCDREQIQNARENPIQAQSKSNVENLLDLDLGATAEEPVTHTIPNKTNSRILDDLGGLSLSTASMSPPSKVTSPPPLPQFASQSPQSQTAPPVTSAPALTTTMDDLLGIFGGQANGGGGFGGENVWSDVLPQSGSQSAQKSKSTNEDILGLF